LNIALKIDVDTYEGTRVGVPALVELLRRHDARATFFFSLGPDHTGRAVRRVFRRGFLSKVSRTSVVENYGWKTLLYGTLLPGPNIGLKCADIMRATQRAGFETAIHCWDHTRWQDFVTQKGREWTQRELKQAWLRYEQIFSESPRGIGAPGWQTTPNALAIQDEMGFAYCSDTRGAHPFLPLMEGKRFNCPQLPTTLPTLDELIGVDGVTEENVCEHLLEASSKPGPAGHVFTLHAELEGRRYLPVLERLLQGWRKQGHQLVALADLYASLDLSTLPVHHVVNGQIPGRSGLLALQGKQVTA